MNRYKSGQLKDRCGLRLSSWSGLPVGWHRLWLGIVNIPSHTHCHTGMLYLFEEEFLCLLCSRSVSIKDHLGWNGGGWYGLKMILWYFWECLWWHYYVLCQKCWFLFLFLIILKDMHFQYCNVNITVVAWMQIQSQIHPSIFCYLLLNPDQGHGGCWRLSQHLRCIEQFLNMTSSLKHQCTQWIENIISSEI